MALIVRGHRQTWDPFRSLWELEREMNRLFSDTAWGTALAPRETGTTDNGAWTVPLDIFERKNELVVKAELPGFRPEDLEVSVVGTTLTIQGQRTQESEEKGDQVFRRELAYGSFYRQIELPHGVDQKAMRASYKNGILEVVLPKREEAKPKQIKVDVN